MSSKEFEASSGVMWCGEAFYRLEVQGVEVLFVLYFLQVWLQCFSRVLESWSSHFVALHPSRHLASSPNVKYFLEAFTKYTSTVKIIFYL
jgi:hypothetical protein